MKPYEDNYVDRTFLESLGELSWIVSCHDHDEPASSPSLLPAKLKLTLILSVTNANFHAYDAWQVSHLDASAASLIFVADHQGQCSCVTAPGRCLR